MSVRRVSYSASFIWNRSARRTTVVTGSRSDAVEESNCGPKEGVRAARDTPRADVFEWTKQLDDELLGFHIDRSNEVLEAHGEIQMEQRDQANRLLRAYAGAIGLFLAGFSFVPRLLSSTNFPPVQQKSVTNPRVLLLLVLLGVLALGVCLLGIAFVRFVATLEAVAQVLTPERIQHDSSVRKVLVNIPFYRPRSTAIDEPLGDVEGDIRREMSAKTVFRNVKNPKKAKRRTLVDQLCRVRENERVIDYNMKQLSHVYEVVTRSLVEALAGGFLLVIATLLLPQIP